jgi:catechol 2,3-dioxygenase-like lactoylglutathione lyase family enzyme
MRGNSGLRVRAYGGDANTLGAMKLAQTILYVQDVEQAAAFYECVFELERGEVNPEGVFIALKTGETTLAFVDAVWVAGNGIDFAPVSSAGAASGNRDLVLGRGRGGDIPGRDRSRRERMVRAGGEAVGADSLVRARSERLHHRDLEPTANALIRYGSVVVSRTSRVSYEEEFGHLAPCSTGLTTGQPGFADIHRRTRFHDRRPGAK